jgi:type IV pilus assembly protein PilQ
MMRNLSFIYSLATVVLLATTPMRTFAQEAAPAIPADVSAAPTPTPAEPAAAQTAPSPAVRVVDAANSNEAVVSMVFDETPISDVIKAFRDATGANIISSGTNLQGNVSVRLDNVPWRKGLSSILDPQGLQLVEQPTGSGIFVVSTKTVEIPKVTRTFELSNAKADEVAKLFAATLGTEGTATPFAAANVVIITATEKQVGECEAIIKSIDKPRPQVFIEARFVEMSAKAKKELGMRWNSLGGDGLGVNFDGATLDLTDSKTTANTAKSGTSADSSSKVTSTDDNGILDIVKETVVTGVSGSSDDVTKTGDRSRLFTGKLSANPLSLALNAFEQIDGISIFSNPKIIVANEETARVDMTTKEPNIEVTFVPATTQNGSDSLTTKLALIPGKEEPFVGEAFYSYGISLQVTPRVSSTGMITVKIEPSISSFIKYFELQGVSSKMPIAKYPVIEIRRIETVFTMASGTTAVIGGLTRTTENNTDSGIPLLRELPWIGPRLFGWKGRGKEQIEIVIFVTVGLADPDTMLEDVGMPKNAIMNRDALKYKNKEPGDRTIQDILSLNDPQSLRAAQHDTVVTEREAGQATPAVEVVPAAPAK